MNHTATTFDQSHYDQLSPPLICEQSHFDEIAQALESVLTEAGDLL